MLELVGSEADRRRKLRDARWFTPGEPGVLGGWFDGAVDACQTAGEDHREREVDVHVGARYAMFDARELLGARDHA